MSLVLVVYLQKKKGTHNMAEMDTEWFHWDIKWQHLRGNQVFLYRCEDKDAQVKHIRPFKKAGNLTDCQGRRTQQK